MPDHPKKILAAIDGSFHGNIAARYSLVFVTAYHAKLFVATVLTNEMKEKEEKAATLAVERIIDEAGEVGVEVEGVLLTGDVTGAIEKFVEENGIDLVIASTRRPYKERRFFARSITSTLMSRLPCSVIGLKIMHPGRSVKPRKILIPLIGDGYKDKERSDIARALADQFDSRITVFHVIELTEIRIKRLDISEKERLIASAEKKIRSFIDELKGHRIDITTKIVIGRNAREAIISEASHHKYDLIIVGTTMRNIIKRVVSGNPVEEILRDTPCDVMLIHFR